MATIKIQDENGKQIAINKYLVNNINVVQSIGQSEDDVMSQKAVTKAIEELREDLMIYDCGEY